MTPEVFPEPDSDFMWWLTECDTCHAVIRNQQHSIDAHNAWHDEDQHT